MTEIDAKQPVLFLVDGSALAYRSHAAYEADPLKTSKGEVVSAIFGFCSQILRVLEREHLTHLAVIFDAKGPTFRHERYAEYKAHRPEMPQDLAAQLAGIRECMDALAIPVIETPGVEADDVIATLARRAVADGFLVRILSGDKDLLQLVDAHVQVLRPGRPMRGDGATWKVMGPDEVATDFGVRPDQIVDYLALVGDTSDNVPGVPAVGDKTARTLLGSFGTLDKLYEGVERLAESGLALRGAKAIQQKLVDHRADAMLSRELVTLRYDVDVGVGAELAALAVRPPDALRARRLFERYEFRSLLDKLPAPAVAAAPEAKDYRIVRGGAELEALVAELRAAGAFALDTETTSIDPLRAELVGISVCARVGAAAYLPFRAPNSPLSSGPTGIESDPALAKLRALLSDETVAKYGQNAKYDLHVLGRAGLPVAGVRFDTMIAHYCVEPSAASHSLDSLALQYFNHVKIKTTDLLGTGKKQITMDRVPVEHVAEYACEDADFTFRLVEPLRRALADSGVEKLYRELELPLLFVLKRMEVAGVALDARALVEMSRKFEVRAAELEKTIHVHAGEPFNVKSSQQLATILYEKLKVHEQLGIKRVPRTETGYSTNADFLEQMEQHVLVAAVLEYRQLEKLRSTYLETLPKLVNPRTLKLHTSFNQAVAATGRLSSADPNLQNIPIRTPLGREIRRAFIPSVPGGSIVSADYSQVELRLLAHLANDDQLRAAFARDEDVHRRTAALVFKVPIEQIEPALRSRAKAINFGIVYGMGAQRLARETGLTFVEAQQFIERYFEVFSGVRRWLDQTLEQARANGYVTTLLGRRRAIPEIRSDDPRVRANAQNVAVNTPLQGTAADLIKLAMLAIDREIESRGLRSRMVLQVHDELVFDVAPGESEAVKELARRCMEGALKLDVRLKVDVGEGPSWLDAH